MLPEGNFESDTDSVTDSEHEEEPEVPLKDIPKKKLTYADAEFWEKKYSEDASPFEWYVSWARLKPVIGATLTKCKRVLHVGCGTSALGADLLETGVESVVNMDVSAAVIKVMARRYRKSEGLEWVVGDIRKTGLKSGSFDAVVDKGTMDALMCSDIAVRVMYNMFEEISRLLKPGGFFIEVSSGCEDLRASYFQEASFNWTLHDTVKIPKLPIKGAFYYVYIAQKNQQRPARDDS